MASPTRSARATASLAVLVVLLVPLFNGSGPASAVLDIAHEPPACSPRDTHLRLSVSVYPPTGIVAVNLSYMAEGAAVWTKRAMTPAGAGEWEGEIDVLSTHGRFADFYFDALNSRGERARSPPGDGSHQVRFGTALLGYCLDETQMVMLLMGIVVIGCLIAVAAVAGRTRRNK